MLIGRRQLGDQIMLTAREIIRTDHKHGRNVLLHQDIFNGEALHTYLEADAYNVRYTSRLPVGTYVVTDIDINGDIDKIINMVKIDKL